MLAVFGWVLVGMGDAWAGPFALDLTHVNGPEVVVGEPLVVRVRGARPGAPVAVGVTRSRGGAPWCPPELLGRCLLIGEPASYVEGRADAAGVVQLTLDTSQSPVGPYVLQAATWGRYTAISRASSGTVLDPLGDEDGDGVRNDVERRRGLNVHSSDSDSDGLPDASDPWPRDALRQDPFAINEQQLPALGLTDPEFSTLSPRIVWLDEAVGDAWIAGLDATTGALLPVDGRGELVASGVAPFDVGQNGPEWWATDRGEEVLVVRDQGGTWGASTTWWDGAAWQVEDLPSPEITLAAYGSTVPGDPDPKIVAWTGIPPSTPQVVLRSGRDPMGVAVPVLPDAYFASWFDGEPRLAVLSGWQELGALDILDLPTGTTERVIEDRPLGIRAWGWLAPELAEDVVLVELRDEGPTARALEAWRRTSTGWALWSRVLPPAGLPIVSLTTPFVWRGHSYVVFQATSLTAPGSKPVSETWVASLDPGVDVLRAVSRAAAPLRRGTEVWTGGDAPWAYYLEGTGSQTRLYRCALGLTP